MRKVEKVQEQRPERTESGRFILPRKRSEYPSIGSVTDSEKADVSTLSKSTNGNDTITPEVMTKAPLVEYVTPDMYKWHKLFMVLQDGCLSCYRTIAESILEVEQVSTFGDQA